MANLAFEDENNRAGKKPRSLFALGIFINSGLEQYTNNLNKKHTY